MSLIPTFEIGLWNAWILTVIFLCLFISPQFLGNARKRIARGEEEKTLSKFTALIAIILWIYSIFLPLGIGTAYFHWADLFGQFDGVELPTIYGITAAEPPSIIRHSSITGLIDPK